MIEVRKQRQMTLVRGLRAESKVVGQRRGRGKDRSYAEGRGQSHRPEAEGNFRTEVRIRGRDRGQSPEVRSQRVEVRDQMVEGRGQKSEGRSHRAEARGRGRDTCRC